MSVMSDAIITYAILRKFITPIKDTEAFKLGLITEDGTPTAKASNLSTERERDAYTLLDRLVFKLKRIFNRMPTAAKLIGGYAAALAFIKESASDIDFDPTEFSIFENIDNTSADHWYSILEGSKTATIQEMDVITIATNNNYVRQLVEAMLAEDGEGAPAGNTVAQVQGLATEPVVSKKKQKEWVDSNATDTRKVEIIGSGQ